MNISKKLVESVIGEDVYGTIIIEDNVIKYCTLDKKEHGFDTFNNNQINIYEFAFKCKEWSTKLGYKIITVSDFDIRHDISDNYKDYYFTAFINMNLFPEINKKDFTHLHDISGSTELDATLEACEWILDEISNQTTRIL